MHYKHNLYNCVILNNMTHQYTIFVIIFSTVLIFFSFCLHVLLEKLKSGWKRQWHGPYPHGLVEAETTTLSHQSKLRCHVYRTPFHTWFLALPGMVFRCPGIYSTWEKVLHVDKLIMIDRTVTTANILPRVMSFQESFHLTEST